MVTELPRTDDSTRIWPRYYAGTLPAQYRLILTRSNCETATLKVRCDAECNEGPASGASVDCGGDLTQLTRFGTAPERSVSAVAKRGA